MSNSNLVVTNILLCKLIEVTEQRLLSHLEEVYLTSGQYLYDTGAQITDVYFPQNATRLSSLLVMSDKSTIEIISVGNEGLAGLPAILGGNFTNTRIIAQMSGKAVKLSVDIIRQELKREETLRQILLLYTQTRLNQVSQIAACKSRHEIEQRLARWLLLIFDSAKKDTLPLTQKFISSMLGVRRASITEIAISFQKQGVIQYSRGQITLLDRDRLESIACECYSKIRAEYKRLEDVEVVSKKSN